MFILPRLTQSVHRMLQHVWAKINWKRTTEIKPVNLAPEPAESLGGKVFIQTELKALFLDSPCSRFHFSLRAKLAQYSGCG